MAEKNSFDTILKLANVDHVMSNRVLDGSRTVPSMQTLRKEAVSGNLDVLIYDFTDTRKTGLFEKVKKIFIQKMVVFFDCDLLVITKCKKSVLLTPVEEKENPQLAILTTEAQLMAAKNAKDIQYDSPALAADDSGDDQEVPNIAFYLDVNYTIPSGDTTFVNSTMWSDGYDKGSRNFCNNAHMALIFQVNLQRSLTYGTGGSSTPDAKIVRICADSNSGGAGIHLNDSLSWKEYGAPYGTLDAYFKEWSTSAIAYQYKINLNASNDKAEVLKTCPENNVNNKYDFNETSGFTLGVTAGVEGNADGAKAKLEASASYTQSKSIAFQTHDYRVDRNTSGSKNIQFAWIRETYPKASSLLNRSTDALWVDTYPADLNRVQAMSYQSFVPKFDVIYKASASETGTTTFSVDCSVQVMPIYHAAYKHYYVFGGHQSYHGTGYDCDGNTVNKQVSFDVDWNHAVFTGGRPVNLQTKAYTNKCISADSAGSISLSDGDLASVNQSFIYDNVGRYVSANNTNLCLDAADLSKLQTASASLTQRWNWKDGSNNLYNEYDSGKMLGVDTSTNKLVLTTGGDGINTDFITTFTKLFSAKSN